MRFVNISLSCSFFTILDILLFLHTLDLLEICLGDLEIRQARRFSSGLFFIGQLSRSVPEYLFSLIIGTHNLIPTSVGFPQFLFFNVANTLSVSVSVSSSDLNNESLLSEGSGGNCRTSSFLLEIKEVKSSVSTGECERDKLETCETLEVCCLQRQYFLFCPQHNLCHRPLVFK